MCPTFVNVINASIFSKMTFTLIAILGQKCSGPMDLIFLEVTKDFFTGLVRRNYCDILIETKHMNYNHWTLAMMERNNKVSISIISLKLNKYKRCSILEHHWLLFCYYWKHYKKMDMLPVQNSGS